MIDESLFDPPPDPCPRPDKQRFWTKELAERGMARAARSAGGHGLNVYRCGDHWHFGHKEFKRRSRQ